MDIQYAYNGPPSSVTLADGREIVLHPGQAVTLPQDDAYVRTLVARGHLIEIPLTPTLKPAPLTASTAEPAGEDIEEAADAR